MRILTVLLSVGVVIMLTVDLLHNAEDIKLSQKYAPIAISLTRSLLPEEPLALTNFWSSVQQKQENEAKLAEKIGLDDNIKRLNIGDKNYRLYGIFKQLNEPFILLKGDDGLLLKVSEGQHVSEFVLFKINNRRIVFKQGEQSLEFNLFEPKTDDIK